MTVNCTPNTRSSRHSSSYHEPVLKASAPHTPRGSPRRHSFACLPTWWSHICHARGFHSFLPKQRMRGAELGTDSVCGTRHREGVQLESLQAPVFSCTTGRERKVRDSSEPEELSVSPPSNRSSQLCHLLYLTAIPQQWHELIPGDLLHRSYAKWALTLELTQFLSTDLVKPAKKKKSVFILTEEENGLQEWFSFAGNSQQEAMIYDPSQPGEDYSHQTWAGKLHSPLVVLQQLFSSYLFIPFFFFF